MKELLNEPEVRISTDSENIIEMVTRARYAQREFEISCNQQLADKVVKIVAKTIHDHAQELAVMAVAETQMGNVKDKFAKIIGKSKAVWQDLKGKKSMDILSIDPITDLIEIAKPIGVVAAIIPMTNPVVTVMSKVMFAVKTKNAIIISPHPKAKESCFRTYQLILEAIKPYGIPEELIQIIHSPTLDKTTELMRESDVIVATGGMPMVKSAYSSGKPSFGVGAGNVQVILDRNINYDEATDKLITGRSFDNGIICSGEQSVIYPEECKKEVFEALQKNGAYIVPEHQRELLVQTLFIDGAINRDIVGKDVFTIAKIVGITLPKETRVMVIESKGVGKTDIVSKEKMCPILAAYPYGSFEEAIQIAKANLKWEGNGHTAAIHSNSQSNIIKAGAELTVSRLVVNAISATTAGGALQNGLAVTNTLGCGTWGNNSISENFTYKHLLNITRIAPLSDKIVVPSDEEIWNS